MKDKVSKKSQIEKEYQYLEKKAKELYPDIDDTISLANNMTAKTNELNEFLNLSSQTPVATSSDQVSL